jgi:hypothetical protein
VKYVKTKRHRRPRLRLVRRLVGIASGGRAKILVLALTVEVCVTVPSVTVTAPLEMVGAIEHFVEAGVIGGKRSRQALAPPPASPAR